MSITSEAVWAATPSTTRGAPTPLHSDNKGQRLTYASNKSIFVRSIDDPSVSKQYTQHTAPTTVARFSPSGFYIASGDITGAVRVWDAEGAETTKGDYHIIAGRINDIAWDGDSQRIIAVGDGKERYGHCITADSGNSVGEISGHSGQINSVGIRQQRPLRAATGSDDTSLVFYHGAPFKFNTKIGGKHERFVYGTSFSPDGSWLVSVGSDKRIWLYDGKTGEAVKQVGEGVHKGSIFGVAWKADGKRFVTCSGDQTVRVWEVESGECVRCWRMGEDGKVSVPDQQVGVTWPLGRSDGLIVSLDLEGNLNYFREEEEAGPVRVVRGHQKAVNAAGVLQEGKTLWTGSADGRARCWDLVTGTAKTVDGEMHSNYVSGVAASPQDGRIYTVGWDDTLRTIDGSQCSFTGNVAKTDGQPKATAVASIGSKTFTLVATTNGLRIFSEGTQLENPNLPNPPTCVAASGETVATGSDDKTITISKVTSSGSLERLTELKDATAPISTLAFSPDTTHLAAGLSNGKIFVYGASSGNWVLETNRWSAHTARVTTVSWSPDGRKAVSGGLDTNVFVWSLADPGKRVKAMNAHKEGVGAAVWVEDGKVVSCGADAAVKVWRVEGVN
ncbi:hypothetical protein MBLNU230_g8098t1 [Neophaeotheca triangularis]